MTITLLLLLMPGVSHEHDRAAQLGLERAKFGDPNWVVSDPLDPIWHTLISIDVYFQTEAYFPFGSCSTRYYLNAEDDDRFFLVKERKVDKIIKKEWILRVFNVAYGRAQPHAEANSKFSHFGGTLERMLAKRGLYVAKISDRSIARDIGKVGQFAWYSAFSNPNVIGSRVGGKETATALDWGSVDASGGLHQSNHNKGYYDFPEIKNTDGKFVLPFPLPKEELAWLSRKRDHAMRR
jgi:hypothetical protein